MWFLISLVSGLSRRACSWTWHLPQQVMNIGNTTQRVTWAPAHMWYLDVLIGLHRPTARRDAACEREQTCCSTRTGTDIGTAMSTEVSGDFALWEGGASPLGSTSITKECAPTSLNISQWWLNRQTSHNRSIRPRSWPSSCWFSLRVVSHVPFCSACKMIRMWCKTASTSHSKPPNASTLARVGDITTFEMRNVTRLDVFDVRAWHLIYWAGSRCWAK